MWTCPKCNRRFVTANMWHSCGSFDLDHHFDGKSEKVRTVFDRLVTTLRSAAGEFEIVPQKTRICFMTETRFANCRTLKSGLVLSFGLPYVVDDPKIRRAKDEGSNWIVHEVRLDDESDIDDALLDWLTKSRELMGNRKRLDHG